MALSSDQLESAQASLGTALGSVADSAGSAGAAIVEWAKEAFTGAMAVGAIVAAVIALIGAMAAWRWVPGPQQPGVDQPGGPGRRRSAPAAGGRADARSPRRPGRRALAAPAPGAAVPGTGPSG